MVILIVLLFICAMIAFFESVTTATYGSWINKKVRGYIEASIDDSYTRLNRYNKNILSGELGAPYISKAPSITSAYYVEEIGMVPRFTKLSYAIGRKFRELEGKESKKAEAIKYFKK